jgi:hypothetical protein
MTRKTKAALTKTKCLIKQDWIFPEILLNKTATIRHKSSKLKMLSLIQET